MSSKHGMSGDPLLSIFLPSNTQTLLAWRCLLGGEKCSQVIFLTWEELEEHIIKHGGKHMLSMMKNPTKCDRVYNRICRICMRTAMSLKGHGCSLEDFPTEDAPEEENMGRQSSSPGPEIEMIEEIGESHQPKSPTNDLLVKQVEEMLSRSKEIPQSKLEVKVEAVRKSRKNLEKKKRKKGGERSSSSSCLALFERPAKLAHGGPAPWSTRLLNPGEETCSVLVY